MIKFAITLLAIGTASTVFASAQSPAEVVAAFHAALAAGDSSRALEFLSPEVVIYEAGGIEKSREDYRSHHLGADITASLGTRRVVIEQATDIVGDLAWVISETRTTGMVRERQIDSRGTETMILKHTPSGWRIVHIHWSSRRAG